MLNYKIYIEKESMFNMFLVFVVYVLMFMLEWFKNLGGVSVIEKINIKKVEVIYLEIDRNFLFVGFVEKEDCFKMNVIFSLVENVNKELFDIMWKDVGINGLNGYRSVGGYCVFMYNVFLLESV